MVKEVVTVKWMCEVCEKRYSDVTEAEMCEQQPHPAPVEVGCIFGNHTPNCHCERDECFYDEDGCIYENATYAVANVSIGHSADTGIAIHLASIACWSCCDGFGTDRLGADTYLWPHNKMHKCFSQVNISSKSYRRMYEWLVERDVQPTLWDGKKAVPAPKPKRSIIRSMKNAAATCFAVFERELL